MSLTDLEATGIITALVLALAVIGFLKGLIRTVLSIVCLGVAGYAALWGNDHASDLTEQWMENPGTWIPKIVATLTGLAVFVICRYLLLFLVDPFNQSKTGKKIGFGLPAAALTLCAGLTILWLGFTGIRYGGTIAELKHTRCQVLSIGDDHGAFHTTPMLLNAKLIIDASSAGQWQRKSDFLDTPIKLKLCKLLILYHDNSTRENMLRDERMNLILNSSSFLELAYNGKIQELTESGRMRELYHAEPLDVYLKKDDSYRAIVSLPSDYVHSFIPKLE